MSNIDSGVRDEKGEWVPENSPVNSPLFSRPFNLKKILTISYKINGILILNLTI